MKDNLKKVWNIDEDDFPGGGNIGDKIKFLLKYSILAPSSHNMQPWRFKINGNQLDMFLDPEKTLPFSDRTNRQAYTSLGCSLANLLLAAEHYKLKYDLEYFPEKSLKDIAVRVRFGKTASDGKYYKNFEGLFSYITIRCSDRFPHLDKKIPISVIDGIKKISEEFGVDVEVVTTAEKMRRIAKIVSYASHEAFNNKIFKEELSHWVISVYSSRRDGIPLYDFGMPYPLTTFASNLIKLTTGKIQQKIDYKNITGSDAAVVISVNKDVKENWIKGGSVFELTWLYCTSAGISLAPLAAAIEHPDSRIKIRKTLTKSNLYPYPLAFARMGYPERRSKHSPRKFVGEVLE